MPDITVRKRFQIRDQLTTHVMNKMKIALWCIDRLSFGIEKPLLSRYTSFLPFSHIEKNFTSSFKNID